MRAEYKLRRAYRFRCFVIQVKRRGRAKPADQLCETVRLVFFSIFRNRVSRVRCICMTFEKKEKHIDVSLLVVLVVSLRFVCRTLRGADKRSRSSRRRNAAERERERERRQKSRFTGCTRAKRKNEIREPAPRNWSRVFALVRVYTRTRFRDSGRENATTERNWRGQKRLKSARPSSRLAVHSTGSFFDLSKIGKLQEHERESLRHDTTRGEHRRVSERTSKRASEQTSERAGDRTPPR